MPKEYYASFEEAEQDIHLYIKYYNNRRVHSSNGYVTPLEKEREFKTINVFVILYENT